MIIIYKCNDNGLYYKTTIVANLIMIVAKLALARSINYDRKVCCKLKRIFTIVNCDPKPFKVQATDQCLSTSLVYFTRICMVALRTIVD